ncbi:MAG: single-stranded-DNA-specific exonuclease RecJ [Anaerolineae bacterium]|nr:single-stranded-DNA-specific exonuclease RecJ [Anaerolineae bacterium]
MNGHRPKRWRIAPDAPNSFVSQLAQQSIHPVLAQVLHRRGFTTVEAVQDFLKLYEADDNPFRMKGMVEAVYRLRMAIRHKEPVAVYGDFDADGVTSTTLLTEALTRLGADVRPYIPDRVDEGYGLNSPALKTLAEDGIQVVVSVDCGIRSLQEVADARSYGIDMIITDHHSVGQEVPPAVAVINPKQPGCPYPEKMLAGVGVTYKIVQALFMEAQRRGYTRGGEWRPEDWLDLVAIGTVADIVPLRGENRVLVSQGLKALNKPHRPGLRALYGEARIRPGQVTTTTIGFMIGPRINAAGRLRTAMLAYNLLTASDTKQGARLAEQLNNINRERQEKTFEMQEWAEALFPGEPDDEPLLFAADPRFEQGIVGLVASRLTDQYYRPSVVVQVGQGESHGSCRSIPEFHITEALDQCGDLLERYGGHAAAAGFTVQNSNIEELSERLWNIAAEELGDQELIPTLDIDAELTLKQASRELVEALDLLEPTGEANPLPIFLTCGLDVAERNVIGAEGRHLKLRLSDGDSTIEAIAYRWGDAIGDLPDRLDVAYHLEINEWNGQQRLQLNIQDMKPST